VLPCAATPASASRASWRGAQADRRAARPLRRGKNRFSRRVPYAPLAARCARSRRDRAARHAEVAEWRLRFADALGPNGRLITDVVPELTAVLGEQPAVPELPPRESKNRFQRTFRDFLALFTRPEHPIALFLDDLQWVIPGLEGLRPPSPTRGSGTT
jgi:hypothetical protein